MDGCKCSSKINASLHFEKLMAFVRKKKKHSTRKNIVLKTV